MIQLADRDTIISLFSRVGTPVPWSMIEDNETYSFARDGEVLAIGGCQEMWQGFGQIWVIMDHEKIIKGKHALWVTRRIKNFLKEKMAVSEFRQLRGMCFYNYHVDWAKVLGFELEGVWLDAGPLGQNVYIVVYHRRN